MTRARMMPMEMMKGGILDMTFIRHRVEAVWPQGYVKVYGGSRVHAGVAI